MKLTIDYSKTLGKVKPMNAVNNGPVYFKNADQNINNMADYTAARIPFARTHDAALFSRYGGEHTVDITAIFPNFDADVDSPESYDFHLTDEYLANILMANTQIFFRLGQRIEHCSKKYGVMPPKDFGKWAAICEHIIAHYNEGWANGYEYGIEYWEIWNEPDGAADDAPYEKHCTWGGTREQFYDLYEITAKRLKARFPELKIGGPALTSVNPDWSRPFLERVRERKIPLDFFSWHLYTANVKLVVNQCRLARRLLDEYGFTETESHLNEWNYVTSFFTTESWKQSLKDEHSIKGAAFVSAVITACQHEAVDMLMYYDARPCAMNGMFSQVFYEKLKGYYPIAAWGEMLEMGSECASKSDISDVYVASAKGESGKMSLVTYYTHDADALPKTFKVEIDGADSEEFTLYLLDDKHDMVPVDEIYSDDGYFTLTMKPNTVVVIK